VVEGGRLLVPPKDWDKKKNKKKGGGGGRGILPTVLGYAMKGEPGKKTHQIIEGASRKCKGKNLK